MSKVIGLGNLLFDHIFVQDSQSTVYKYSRGGGTISNILANLSFLGIDNSLLGFCGTMNSFGKSAMLDLKNLGADITNVIELPLKQIPIVFQVNKRGKNGFSHKFSYKCIVCENTPKRLKTQMDYINYENLQNIDFNRCTFLVADRVNRKVIDLIKYGKNINPGITSVVDIGYVSNFRFMNIAEIINSLCIFDNIFMNNDVYKYLCKRSTDNFISAIINNNDYPKLFALTKGKYGVEYYINDRHCNYNKLIDALAINPLCSSGSGDSLIAYYLKNILSQDLSFDELVLNENLMEEIFVKSTAALDKKLNSLGARGHLPSQDLNLSISSYQEKNLTEIRDIVYEMKTCPFCGSEVIEEKKQNPKPSKMNFEKIIDSLSFKGISSLFSFENISLCKEILNSGKTYSVIGTGGSKSPALFISQIIKSHFQKNSQFAFPFEYISGLIIPTDWLIILSYSGKTEDCKLVIKKARDLGVKRIALITGNQKPKLSSELRNINQPDGDILINYFNNILEKERGFLSFSGVVIPSILFAIASEIGINEECLREFFENARKTSNQNLQLFSSHVSSSGITEIIGSSFATPALYDLESKLIEGGISAVQTHESKDFSHGRFMYSFKKPGIDTPKILIQAGNNEYEDELFNKLSIITRNNSVLRIFSTHDGIKGGLDLLIQIQYFIYFLSKELFHNKKDVTKPTEIPREGLELYNWKS